MLDCIDSRCFPSFLLWLLEFNIRFEALPGKLDIKRWSPSIHYIWTHAFINDNSHLPRITSGIVMGSPWEQRGSSSF